MHDTCTQIYKHMYGYIYTYLLLNGLRSSSNPTLTFSCTLSYAKIIEIGIRYKQLYFLILQKRRYLFSYKT